MIEELAGQLDEAIAAYQARRPPRIFISHRHQDKDIARTVIDLLESAFEIAQGQIRCTSVPGYKLAVGSHSARARSPSRAKQPHTRGRVAVSSAGRGRGADLELGPQRRFRSDESRGPAQSRDAGDSRARASRGSSVVQRQLQGSDVSRVA